MPRVTSSCAHHILSLLAFACSAVVLSACAEQTASSCGEGILKGKDWTEIASLCDNSPAALYNVATNSFVRGDLALARKQFASSNTTRIQTPNFQGSISVLLPAE